jgi:adenosylcobinamide-GDP ribazoletransferase
LALFVWVFLTRGLHLDGVADVCDALFSGRDKEGRRLILKDPRVGTFGVLGVLFTLGMKGVSVFGLHGSFPFLFTPVLGRTVALLFGAFFPPSSPQGLGGEFVGKVGKGFFLFWLAVLLFWGLEVGGISALLKTLLTFGIMFTLGKKLSHSFGGLSGDMVGAGIEWGEALFLFLLRV